MGKEIIRTTQFLRTCENQSYSGHLKLSSSLTPSIFFYHNILRWYWMVSWFVFIGNLPISTLFHPPTSFQHLLLACGSLFQRFFFSIARIEYTFHLDPWTSHSYAWKFLRSKTYSIFSLKQHSLIQGMLFQWGNAVFILFFYW